MFIRLALNHQSPNHTKYINTIPEKKDCTTGMSSSALIEELVGPLHPPPDVLEALLDELSTANPRYESAGVIKNTSGCLLSLISGNRIVKYGRHTTMGEAAAMHYVRLNTSIPVPKVHHAFRHGPKNSVYIVMDFIQAETLDNAQFKLSDDQLLKIAKQLEKYVAILRELGGEHTSMGSWPDGPYRNVYFYGFPLPPTTFQTTEEFMDYWRKRTPAFFVDAPELEHTAIDRKVVLTHGDLSSRNILIKDGEIVSILDWDSFGWYPSFWEYLGASRGAWHKKWIHALTTVFGPKTYTTSYYSALLHRTYVPEYY